MDFSAALVWVALIAFVAFHQWLRHHRRILLHRERLAAVEKGIELPQVEHEVRRGAWNVQRILLLAGLTWVSIGVSAFVVLSTLIAHGTPTGPQIPNGIQWIAMAPVGIGLAHLIVYAVGAKSER